MGVEKDDAFQQFCSFVVLPELPLLTARNPCIIRIAVRRDVTDEQNRYGILLIR